MIVSACPMSNVGLFATLRHSHPLIYFAVYIPHDHDIESLVMSCPGSQMSHTFQSLWHLWESLRYHKSPQWCQWCLCSCMLFNSALQVFSLLVTFEHVTCNRLFQAEAVCPESWRIAHPMASNQLQRIFAPQELAFSKPSYYCRTCFFLSTGWRHWDLGTSVAEEPRARETAGQAGMRSEGFFLVLHAGGMEFCFFSPGYIFLDSLYRVVSLQTRCLDNPKIQINAFLEHVKVSHTLSEYIYIISELCPIVKCSLFFCFFLQTEHFSGLSRPSKQRWIGCTLSGNLRGKSWQVVITGVGTRRAVEIGTQPGEPGSLKNKIFKFY